MAESFNPHDPSDLVRSSPDASPDEVNALVDAAAEAAQCWSDTAAIERGRAIGSIGERLESHADELAELIAREVGKPISEARAEVARAVAIHRYFAQMALGASGSVYPAGTAATLLMTRRFPIGVCGLITPWNFPVAIPSWKAAPALAFGNAVVLKPAPQAGAVAARYLELARECVPPGVFQLVEGDAEAGGALVDHAEVGAVSFTGSRTVGIEVAKAAVARDARVQCEMSGNNASVVLADADLASAARTIASAAMGYAGQKCTATSRIICERPAYEEFRELFIAAVEGMSVIDPMSTDCAVGPVIDDESRRAAHQAVDQIDGDVIAGGEDLDQPGFYMRPTVVEIDESVTVDEEIFAPVALLQPASDDDAALALANRTRFGLVAAVFTSRLAQAQRFSERLRAGLVRVNAPTSGVEFHVPFGGVKESTVGAREQGRAAHEFFTEERTLLVNSRAG